MPPYPYWWTRTKSYELMGIQLGDPWNTRSIYRRGATIEATLTRESPPMIVGHFELENDARAFFNELALRLIAGAVNL